MHQGLLVIWFASLFAAYFNCLPEVRGRMQCSQAPYKNDKAFSFLFDTWTEELSAEEVRPILDIDFHRPTLGMLLAGMVVIPAF